MKNKITLLVLPVLILTSVFALAGSKRAEHFATALSTGEIDGKTLLSDLKFLSSDEMKGRETGTATGEIARAYLIKRYREIGLSKFGGDFAQEFSFQTRTKQKVQGANVVGYIPGSTHKGKFIVVTAHYDHLGLRNGQIFNGADDNASGTAALLAIATYFKKNPPKYSLIFAAVDAEEKGLQGSKYFVANSPVKKGSILLNINMDMIAHNDKNELYVGGIHHYPFLKKYVEPVKKLSSVKLIFGHDSPDLGSNDWTFSSDHAPFHRAKIPFIYFGVEDHKDYHKPTDIYPNINQDFYVKAVGAILGVVKYVDKNFKSKAR